MAKMAFLLRNMARAGVVSLPSNWPFSGYNEIQEPRRKTVLIDYERLQALLGTDSYDQLKTTHKGWVEEQLQGAGKKRQDEWTASIDVGSKSLIENVKAQLRFRAKGRDVIAAGERYQLRQNLSSYKAVFGAENEDIDLKNTYFWDVK
jgi:hypothetical protein